MEHLTNTHSLPLPLPHPLCTTPPLLTRPEMLPLRYSPARARTHTHTHTHTHACTHPPTRTHTRMHPPTHTHTHTHTNTHTHTHTHTHEAPEVVQSKVDSHPLPFPPMFTAQTRPYMASSLHTPHCHTLNTSAPQPTAGEQPSPLSLSHTNT